METSLVYITTSGSEEAEKIAGALVEQRLVSCVNIIDKISSLYWWENKIQKDSEAILIAKTRKTMVRKVTDTVKSLHSYKCPCIVSVPITGGNQDFLEWIVKETEAP